MSDSDAVYQTKIDLYTCLPSWYGDEKEWTTCIQLVVWNLGAAQTFPYPMDRAEVLHAQSYNIKGKRKNTPGENELVIPWNIFTFRSQKYTWFAPQLPPNMPAETKSITLQEDKPSLRVTS